MSDTESREPRSPALLAGRAPSRETAGQIGRYLIGAIVALVLDATLVSLLLSAGLPIFGARTLGLMAGMTTTYFFNRRYTFDVTHGASLHDWSRYLAAQSLGSALNFAVSSALLYLGSRVWWQVWAAIGVGAAVGFSVNFFIARRLLHRRG